MAELVDAYVSGAYIERCAGSTPVRGTKEKETLIDYQSVRVFLLSSVSTACQRIEDSAITFPAEKICLRLFFSIPIYKYFSLYLQFQIDYPLKNANFSSIQNILAFEEPDNDKTLDTANNWVFLD